MQSEVIRRGYVRRVEVLDQSINLIKVRLSIAPDLFIQVYRNDRFDTTNLALIHNHRCLYALDQVESRWHRHTIVQPDDHDVSPEGRRAVDLPQFIDEIESILAALGLP